MMTNFKKNSSKGTANHLLSYVSTNTYSRIHLSCILDFSWLTFNSDSYNANKYNDKTMILIINRSIKLNNKCNANFFRFLFKL